MLRVLTSNSNVFLNNYHSATVGVGRAFGAKEFDFVLELSLLFLGAKTQAEDAGKYFHHGFSNDETEGERDGCDHETSEGVFLWRAIPGWDDCLEPHPGNHGARNQLVDCWHKHGPNVHGFRIDDGVKQQILLMCVQLDLCSGMVRVPQFLGVRVDLLLKLDHVFVVLPAWSWSVRRNGRKNYEGKNEG